MFAGPVERDMQIDILIKGGTVVDGSGADAYAADVRLAPRADIAVLLTRGGPDAVPVMASHGLRAGQRRLFGGDVDIKIGVKLIKRAYFYAVQRPCLLKHPLIRMRVMRIGMGINYQNH